MCALKTARKYHVANGQPERIDVIGFDGSFHGRTYAAVNAAGNPSYVDGFGPRLPGYVHLTFGDHEAIKAAIASPTTAAVIVEPVQGEGGARAVPDVCLRGLRELCDEHGVLLDLRRGAVRAGPHRQAVRLRVVGRRAGHHAAGQGARRRLPRRRMPRDRRGRQGHDGGRPRLDLWRQPAGDGGGDGGAGGASAARR